MKKSDEMIFAETITMLGVVFPTDITPTLAKAYFVALEEFTIDQVKDATAKHIKNGKFFPKPVELSDIINVGKPNSEDKAVLAWLSITNSISKIGPYRSLTLKDKLALEIINHIGGWSHVCSLSYKELDFKKKDFIQAYTTTAITSDKDLPKSLAGLHDIARLESKDQ